MFFIKFFALAFTYAVLKYIITDLWGILAERFSAEQAQEILPVLPKYEAQEEPAGLKLAMIDLDFNTELIIAKERELSEANEKANGYKQTGADVPDKLLRKIEKLRRDICNAEKKCIKAEAAMQKYM